MVLDALLALQQGVAATLSHTTAAVTQAESDLDEASSALETFKANTIDGASQLQVAEAECLDRQSRLDALNQAHGSREAQHAQVEQLAQQRQQAETELASCKLNAPPWGVVIRSKSWRVSRANSMLCSSRSKAC